MKKLVSIFITLFAVIFSSFAVPSLVGIKADNSEQIFSLEQVQNIKIVNNDGLSMQVNGKDGSSASGFQKIVFSDINTGVENTSSNTNIAVYPNPVEKVIYVTGLENDVDLKVIDLEGKLVKSVTAQSINVEDLKPGTYVLSVDSKVVKFIKK